MDTAKLPQQPARFVSAWNVANFLTVVRLVMVPGLVLALVASHGDDDGPHAHWRVVAFGIFSVAMFTDYADGMIARSRDIVTPFGKIADPIADKALIGAALIGLSWFGLAPWWATIIILARELGVTLLRLWLVRRYASEGVIPASWGGKLKTAVQALAIGGLLVPWKLFGLPRFDEVAWWLLMVAMVITAASGVDYVRQAAAIVRDHPRGSR